MIDKEILNCYMWMIFYINSKIYKIGNLEDTKTILINVLLCDKSSYVDLRKLTRLLLDDYIIVILYFSKKSMKYFGTFIKLQF